LIELTPFRILTGSMLLKTKFGCTINGFSKYGYAKVRTNGIWNEMT